MISAGLPVLRACPAPRPTARPMPRMPQGAARRRSWRRRASKLAGAAVPVIEVDDPRRALALAAARFYGRQPETMVAVTGTSGKTSVASFTRQIWEHDGHRGRQHRHDRRRRARPQRIRLADDARSGRAAQASGRTRGFRRHACLDGGVEPRPRPAPARRREACRRRASPISAATTWTIIRRSRTIIRAKLRLFDDAAAEGRAGGDLRRRSVVGADDRRRQGAPASMC